MKRYACILLAGLMSCSLYVAAQEQKTETDQQIRLKLIRASIAGYSGSCTCPYNSDRAGRSCGARSAYSRKGGYAPLCYERDVTTRMIDEYRKRM